MSPKQNKTESENGLNEMSMDDMLGISGGIILSRLRAKCPVPGCGFECARMTELNVHMKQCHPERC